MSIMDEDQFKRLGWKAQNDLLRPHLEWVLRHITEPRPTHFIAWSMSERTGFHEDVIARVLLRRFAPMGKYATQDGEDAHAFGRSFKRWRWHPLKDEEV